MHGLALSGQLPLRLWQLSTCSPPIRSWKNFAHTATLVCSSDHLPQACSSAY